MTSFVWAEFKTRLLFAGVEPDDGTLPFSESHDFRYVIHYVGVICKFDKVLEA